MASYLALYFYLHLFFPLPHSLPCSNQALFSADSPLSGGPGRELVWLRRLQYHETPACHRALALYYKEHPASHFWLLFSSWPMCSSEMLLPIPIFRPVRTPGSFPSPSSPTSVTPQGLVCGAPHLLVLPTFVVDVVHAVCRFASMFMCLW